MTDADLTRQALDEMRDRATCETFGPVIPVTYTWHYRRDVPALLDALDAAEEENGRLREALHESQQAANALRSKVDRQAWSLRRAAEHRRQGDAARAEVAALRGRIEGLAAGIGDVIDRLLEDGTPEYAGVLVDLRALAADEGERTGR